MENHDALKTADKWLMSIMSMFPYINGRTMLQKFGLLSFYEVLKEEDFFDDWQADKYGGFSPRQASSLKNLEAGGYVRSYEIITGHGEVHRYSLTKKGRHAISYFLKTNASKLEDIRRILSYYQSRPLKDLLRDAYQKYPHLTVNSKIAADVNKTMALDPYTEHESDNPSQSGSEAQEMLQVSPPADQHVFGDMEFRKQLAKSIGLDEVPDLDPRSFDRIRGLWSKQMGTESFDAVEAVREVRDG